MPAPSEYLQASRAAALKALRGTPERHKRERMYELLAEMDASMCEELRATMGDTDGNRDTRSTKEGADVQKDR